MATTTKTWTFPTDTQSWVATVDTSVGSTTTALWQSADTSVADGSGCLEMNMTSTNKNDINYWEITGTWVSLFAIPGDSVVTEISTPDDYDWRCTVFVRGDATACTTGPFELRNSAGTLQATFSAGLLFTGTGSWATRSGSTVSVPAAISAAGTTVKLRLNNILATVPGGGPSVILRQDQIVVTINFASKNRLVSVLGKLVKFDQTGRLFKLPF